MTNLQKTYWAVIKDSKLILTDHKLPFYWKKSVADEVAERFNGKVVKIDGEKLHAVFM